MTSIADVPSCKVTSPVRLVALPGETVELACGVDASPSGEVTYDWWTTDTDAQGAVSSALNVPNEKK